MENNDGRIKISDLPKFALPGTYILIKNLSKLVEFINISIHDYVEKRYKKYYLEKYNIKEGSEITFYNDPAYKRYNETCEGFVNGYDSFFNDYTVLFYNIEIDPERIKQKECLLFEIKEFKVKKTEINITRRALKIKNRIESQSNWKKSIELSLLYLLGVLDVVINIDPENKTHLMIEIYTHDEKLLGIVKNFEIEDAINKTIPAGLIYSIRKIKKEGE